VPALTVLIPPSLSALLRDTAARRGTSLDSLVSAVLSEYLKSSTHRLYQISTSTALVEGVAQGAVTSRTLLAHGDFGLGTFESLAGEMVIVDGAIYQVRGDGTVRRRKDEFRIPFAVVTRFHESVNLFYALRVEGLFEKVHTRAVAGLTAGTGLVDAAKAQKEFHFSNVEGTLVCSLNIPGYHFHFISKDRGRIPPRSRSSHQLREISCHLPRIDGQ
jgi:acetolactate decarboxylase